MWKQQSDSMPNSLNNVLMVFWVFFIYFSKLSPLHNCLHFLWKEASFPEGEKKILITVLTLECWGYFQSPEPLETFAPWKERLVPWGGFHSLWKEKQGPGKGFSSLNNSGILLIHVALSCPWLTAHWISHQGVVAKFRAKVNTRICGVTGDGWTPTDRVVYS